MVEAWRLPTTSMLAIPRTSKDVTTSRHYPQPLACSLFRSTQRRHGFSCSTTGRRWRRRVVTGALSTSPEGEPGDPVDERASGLGSTRLGRLASARRRELLQRWNTVRRNFPAKIFLLLFGFFSANALATILGQTGDWDVVAAGVLVAVIEGIGHLVYTRVPAFLGDRGKATIELVNYWKIGFTFALFVDAFKVGS